MSADLIISCCWPPASAHLTEFLSLRVIGLSLQDPFPKGVIPLTAIEMTRSSKDNKFQVITSQRVFVFRTESEGEGQSPTPVQGGAGEAM